MFDAKLCVELQTTRAMNADSSNVQTEVCWKTYAKAAAALVPAVVACLMAQMFVLPKVRMIWADAGLGLNGPMVAALVVLQYFLPTLLVVVISFTLVEWCWRGAARFRGALTTIAVFLVNTGAFFGITAMCVAAVLAAPNMHRAARVGGDRGADLQPAIRVERPDSIASR